jgi:hypothetical protein
MDGGNSRHYLSFLVLISMPKSGQDTPGKSYPCLCPEDGLIVDLRSMMGLGCSWKKPRI